MWQYITDHQYHKWTLVWEFPPSSLHAMETAVFLFKLLLHARLILVFLNFFGIASWKRYNDEDVYISSTEQYSNNIKPPGITICPGLRNRYHNILANPCSSKNGTLDIVSCIEEASFSLSDNVLDGGRIQNSFSSQFLQLFSPSFSKMQLNPILLRKSK